MLRAQGGVARLAGELAAVGREDAAVGRGIRHGPCVADAYCAVIAALQESKQIERQVARKTAICVG